MRPPLPTAYCSPATTARLLLAVDDSVSPDLSDQCGILGLALINADRIPDRLEVAMALACSGQDTQAIRRGLSAPFTGFIELGPEGLLGVGMRTFETARAGGLALSLLTSTTFGVSMVELASEAITRRFRVTSADTAMMIEICLAEAIGNAVIHGNLGIPDHLRATPKGFEDFRGIMRERLADPALAGRRIEVNVTDFGPDHLAIAVSDQGRGFDLDACLARGINTDAKSGRGLGLIRKACASVLAEDGGSTLVMTFAR